MEKVLSTLLIASSLISNVNANFCNCVEICERQGDYMLWTADGGFWIENGKVAGKYGDPKNITDTIYEVERGREVYDPDTDAWYWLDADNGGKVAVNKEVWFPYIFQDEELGSTEGKWVRYDFHGAMVNYFCLIEENNVCYLYYYDDITGKMLKGNVELRDFYDEENPVKIKLFFDRLTGRCRVTEEIVEELEKLHLEEWPVYVVRRSEYMTMKQVLNWRYPPIWR